MCIARVSSVPDQKLQCRPIGCVCLQQLLRPVNVFSLCFLQFLCIANDPWATRNNNNSQWSVDKQCLTHLWKEAIQPQTNYYKNNTTTNILLIQTDMYHRHQQAKLLIKVLAAFRLL